MTKRRDYKNNLTFLCLAFCVSLLLVGCEGSSDGDGGSGGGGGGGGLSGTPVSTACLNDINNISIVGQIALANPTQGAQLYDKWWVAAGTTEPTTDHPLWSTQNTNTRMGADTWRCKECHGWDYAGVSGVYGDTGNSHYTGFTGLQDSASRAPIEVFCAIKSGFSDINPAHNFSTVLSDVHILHLTSFITSPQIGTMPTGLIDTTGLITIGGSLIGANSGAGGTLYGTQSCGASNCHGANGDGQHESL